MFGQQGLEKVSTGFEKDEQTNYHIDGRRENRRQKIGKSEALREKEGLSIAPSLQGIGPIHYPEINNCQKVIR